MEGEKSLKHVAITALRFHSTFAKSIGATVIIRATTINNTMMRLIEATSPNRGALISPAALYNGDKYEKLQELAQLPRTPLLGTWKIRQFRECSF
jgi:hypothetical protein